MLEDKLIDKSELLDSVADNDDIEWPHSPFEIRPDSASPESPDELLAIIQFAGSPGLQEKLRGLCREFIRHILCIGMDTLRMRGSNDSRQQSSEVGDTGQ